MEQIVGGVARHGTTVTPGRVVCGLCRTVGPANRFSSHLATHRRVDVVWRIARETATLPGADRAFRWDTVTLVSTRQRARIRTRRTAAKVTAKETSDGTCEASSWRGSTRASQPFGPGGYNRCERPDEHTGTHVDWWGNRFVLEPKFRIVRKATTK